MGVRASVLGGPHRANRMECSIDVFYVNKKTRRARLATAAETLNKLSAAHWFKFLLGPEVKSVPNPAALAADVGVGAAANSRDELCFALRVSFYGLTPDGKRALSVTKELLSIIGWGAVCVRVS